MPTALQRAGTSSLQAFSHASYTLVRPLFSWRRIYRVYAPDGSLSAVVEQPWGRLAMIVLPGGGELGIYEPKHPLAPHRGG